MEEKNAVLTLLCKFCNTILSKRGMKVRLVSKPDV